MIKIYWPKQIFNIKICNIVNIIKFHFLVISLYRHFHKFHLISLPLPCLLFCSWHIVPRFIFHLCLRRILVRIVIFQADYRGRDIFGSLGSELEEGRLHLMLVLKIVRPLLELFWQGVCCLVQDRG